jgi:hypothetical protein
LATVHTHLTQIQSTEDKINDHDAFSFLHSDPHQQPFGEHSC